MCAEGASDVWHDEQPVVTVCDQVHVGYLWQVSHVVEYVAVFDVCVEGLSFRWHDEQPVVAV
ncbi:MAG: hypothetical protein A2X93_04970 [Deltaproteobacteria bacterium GWC2_56_8]|nr:MAG: hypothetical protein A2X93_04970 [Deltaproteobacteria bacterium GWC2_56_8]